MRSIPRQRQPPLPIIPRNRYPKKHFMIIHNSIIRNLKIHRPKRLRCVFRYLFNNRQTLFVIQAIIALSQPGGRNLKDPSLWLVGVRYIGNCLSNQHGFLTRCKTLTGGEVKATIGIIPHTLNRMPRSDVLRLLSIAVSHINRIPMDAHRIRIMVKQPMILMIMWVV